MRHFKLIGSGTDGLYKYGGASIELSGGGRYYWATVRFKSQEKDFEGRSSDEALEKAMAWIDAAPEHPRDFYGRPRPLGETRRYPKPQPSTRFAAPHRVADFNTLDDLIAHARDDLGATHVVVSGPETRLYFPRGGQYPYEEARVWRKGGYWHAEGPSARKGVLELPEYAQPIGGRGGRRAAESPRAGNPTTKPGKHGTLYLYQIEYKDDSPESPQFSTRLWAYNLEHAEERFYEGLDSEGWRIISIARVPESGSMHRATRHRPIHEAARSVRDYIAVDRRGRTIAGPFKSYGDAKNAAGTAGVVQYVRPGASEARRRRAPKQGQSPEERAYAAGEQYGQDQIGSDHFLDWVYDQLVEASKMPADRVLPLKTQADALEIARNMFQQFIWDAQRQGAAQEALGSDATRDEIHAFYEGFRGACDTSREWLADELLTKKRELEPGATETRPPATGSAKSGRRAATRTPRAAKGKRRARRSR
jgi:hypothetical protein